MSRQFHKDMLERMTALGTRISRMADRLPNYPSSLVLARQVIRSSTSVGANYQEAQRSRTSKEFISKLHIALQEAEETRHWLKTIAGCGHVRDTAIDPLLSECTELIAILVSSINTTRRRMKT